MLWWQKIEWGFKLKHLLHELWLKIIRFYWKIWKVLMEHTINKRKIPITSVYAFHGSFVNKNKYFLKKSLLRDFRWYWKKWKYIKWLLASWPYKFIMELNNFELKELFRQVFIHLFRGIAGHCSITMKNQILIFGGYDSSR